MADRFEQEVMRSLGKIEGTVEAILRQQVDDKAYTISVSSRVGRLERANSHRKGFTAALSAAVSAIVALLAMVFK